MRVTLGTTNPSLLTVSLSHPRETCGLGRVRLKSEEFTPQGEILVGLARDAVAQVAPCRQHRA